MKNNPETLNVVIENNILKLHFLVQTIYLVVAYLVR